MDHLVEQHTGAPNIGAAVDLRVAARLFRRHVVRAADDAAHARQLGGQCIGVRPRHVAGLDGLVVELRHAEVDELWCDVAVDVLDEDDVVRLEIAVDDPLEVGRGQTADDRQEHLHRFDRWELPTFVEVVLQRVACEQLHDKERVAVRRLTEVHHTHDRRMVELRGRSCFLKQTQGGFLARHVASDQFERHVDMQRHVPRGPNGAHPALAQQAVESVLPSDQRARLVDVAVGIGDRLGGCGDSWHQPQHT